MTIEVQQLLPTHGGPAAKRSCVNAPRHRRVCGIARTLASEHLQGASGPNHTVVAVPGTGAGAFVIHVQADSQVGEVSPVATAVIAAAQRRTAGKSHG